MVLWHRLEFVANRLASLLSRIFLLVCKGCRGRQTIEEAILREGDAEKGYLSVRAYQLKHS